MFNDEARYHQESLNNSNIHSSFRRARGQVENKLRDLGTYLPLYNAACKGDWKEARHFLDHEPEALTAKIAFTSETALHIAVGTGRAIDFVEKLVREMTPESLALTNEQGDTALSIAAMVGNIPAAMILVNNNPDLPNIPGNYGFPIHIAARFGHRKMLTYLLSVTKTCDESNPCIGAEGGRLLMDVITADFYDIALDLVGSYPELALLEDNGGGSPLTVLTTKSTIFSSGRVPSLWSSLLFTDLEFSSPRKMEERSSMERQARQLVKALCKEISELDDAKVFSLLQQPLHNAAMLGIPEIIVDIVEAFPPAIWFTDKNKYNIFQLAILYRREEVFNLIYQMTDFKYLITSYTDSQDNNMLHLVARLPPSDRLNLVSGPAYQFQREMQWVKEVAKCVQPAQRVAKNKEGKTPEMVFMDAHEELMKDGVEWIKKTITSSTVFATLVATVAIAGGLNIPEGSKVGEGDRNGGPAHYRPALTVYVLADSISLFLSLISIVTFLSIIDSRYTDAHFLSVFPQRLSIGLSILLSSIIMVVLAFCLALYIHFSPVIPLLERGFLVLILVPFFPIVYRIVWLSSKEMFGKKGQRTLL